METIRRNHCLLYFVKGTESIVETFTVDEIKDDNAKGPKSGITINTKGIELTGRGVKAHYSNGNYEVTENLLHKLQIKYNVMTNF